MHARKEAQALMGKAVRLKKPVSRREFTVPAGRTGTVGGYTMWGSTTRFTVHIDPCTCCGISPHLNALRRDDFDLVE